MSEIEEPTVEPEAPEAEETPAEEAARVYAGKFNSDDDLEKGYLESEKAMRTAQEEAAQARQEASDYQAQVAAYEEAQNAPDPFNPLANFGLDDEDWKNIARSVEVNPQETLAWAQTDEIKRAYPDMERAVKQYWASLDPWQAGEEAASRAFAAEREKIEKLQAAWDERQAQERAEKQQAALSTAVVQIRKLPDFEQYKTRVGELIAQNAMRDDDPRFSDPDQMFDYAYTMYARAKDEAYQRQVKEQEALTVAGEEPTTAAPGAKARTQTRSTAAAGGTSSDPVMQALYDATAAQAQTS